LNVVVALAYRFNCHIDSSGKWVCKWLRNPYGTSILKTPIFTGWGFLLSKIQLIYCVAIQSAIHW